MMEWLTEIDVVLQLTKHLEEVGPWHDRKTWTGTHITIFSGNEPTTLGYGLKLTSAKIVHERFCKFMILQDIVCNLMDVFRSKNAIKSEPFHH